jgi:hypothetical protein
MDKRLIFRYRWRTFKSQRGDGARKAGRRAGVAAAKRVGGNPEAWGRLRDTKANPAGPGFPEKPRWGCRQRPYRRPTQVGGCESTKVDG